MEDLQKELDEANSKLPMSLPDGVMSIDYQLRTTALILAQRHVGDTCVKDGGLYQALKLDNKLGQSVSVDDVIKAALVFERYLWGEWSKGIAENAINAVSTDIADELEKKYKDIPDEPIRGAP